MKIAELGADLFGDSAEVTFENIMRAFDAGPGVNRWAVRVFGRAYWEAVALHWRVCHEACTPHLRAYQEAIAHLWRAHEEACAPHRRAYEDAIAPHLRAYDEATAPLLGVYNEATAAHLRVYNEATAPYWRAYTEARAKTIVDLANAKNTSKDTQ